ncbi:hypothetical protein K7432_009202 [Basidiobolus ranarum]|uniref:Uncharacterized protein n=1 Tax=Basidiobolus ranarum TaxID=34480 RepID=A0ABR2WQV5_9FUNG
MEIPGDFSWRQLYASLTGDTLTSFIDRAVDNIAKQLYGGITIDVLKAMPHLAVYQVLQKPVFIHSIVRIPEYISEPEERIRQQYFIPQCFIGNRVKTGFELDSLRESAKQNLNNRSTEVNVAFINYSKVNSVLFVESSNSPSSIVIGDVNKKRKTIDSNICAGQSNQPLERRGCLCTQHFRL